MRYRKVCIENPQKIFKQFYIDIHGGIDGYYERTILDAKIYEIYEDDIIAYFSVHEDRGLTSLYMQDNCTYKYIEVLKYTLGLSLFDNILFTQNDLNMLESLNKLNIRYEIQAYNFQVNNKIESFFPMKPISNKDLKKVRGTFGEFIDYNKIDLEKIESFYFEDEFNNIISFGALEPLKLNDKKYEISMIVNEKFRNQGYGSNTVKFLIKYLQSKGLECNARCYVQNETSKKTLLKSGMILSNFLYKAEEIEIL